MKALSLTEQTRRVAALRRTLVAVVKSAPMTKRTALAEAILASRELTNDMLPEPLIDGRKLLNFIGAACRKG
jgi:hypothetical protein